MRIVSRNKTPFIRSLLALIIVSSGFSFACAETGKSGLQLPRFVSLKSKKVNMRVGPGSEYQVEWMYIKRGLPVEIIQEFDNWRKIRDPQGNEGWILHSLLSGRRTAIISPWDRGKEGSLISMLDAPDGSAKLKAQLQPGVIAKVNYCENQWCELSAANAHGYVKQELLWGVYPDETFDN
ncbi:MAG: SH3 domain-containing protein [Rhizobiaceae bacterium]